MADTFTKEQFQSHCAAIRAWALPGAARVRFVSQMAKHDPRLGALLTAEDDAIRATLAYLETRAEPKR